MNRRTFLKLAGMGSFSFVAGCEPQKTLYSLVNAPDDMVTGKGTMYASTCRECPAGCGILAKNREGRVIKIEGNPQHPINQGRICMRGQAALQAVYNPDRIRTPLLKEAGVFRPISFASAKALIRERTQEAARGGRDRVRLLTECVGTTQLRLFTEALKSWQSDGPMVFEPFAYEALKTANKQVFQVDGLVSYRIENADLLLSFGADFLETWLSPVEYAIKFKAMHAYRNRQKGFFCHIAPYQSLTAANADLWLPCHPGGEIAITMGLIREVLVSGRGNTIREFVRSSILKAAESYTPARVVEMAGISEKQFDMLKGRLLSAKSPLILGTGTGDTVGNGLHTNMAVNLLNVFLDPELKNFDGNARHQIEVAASRHDTIEFFSQIHDGAADVLILNHVNPVFHRPGGNRAAEALKRDSLFVVSFSNFLDETSQLADLVFPVRMPLESWDAYEGKKGFVSTLQPAMGRLTDAPHLGDVILDTAFDQTKPAENYKSYLIDYLATAGLVQNPRDWVNGLQKGGFETPASATEVEWFVPYTVSDAFHTISQPGKDGLMLVGAPSIRFFDGRGANRTWLTEIPDPITKIAWQTPVLVHPDTMASRGLDQGDVVTIQSKQGSLEAAVYESEGVQPDVLMMSIGQGHSAYGRYAQDQGVNPTTLFPSEVCPLCGGPFFAIHPVSIHGTGDSQSLAHTDGSRVQHGRKIAPSVAFEDARQGKRDKADGLTMWDFPLTLPLPEGYDPKRDFYPPIEYEDYRWAMVVDLDRCIGCGACSAACYAENNLGVVGEEQIINGREMSWLRVERYHNPDDMTQITFLPFMCQQCDNAPCEAVCPVYAPHHSKEGLNNQIYNRCIGTRFCAQNCPYKIRRFNWYTWEWPAPLELQLNPDVTVRSKGVMEKCSFCIQRIKNGHDTAKNEKRKIRDGEITPACVQTCPTNAFVFGNLLDRSSRVRRMVDDPRAYQVMGYLNAKPAVIYLKKVRHDAI